MLPGQVDSKHFSAKNSDGAIVDPSEGVFPLVSQRPDGLFVTIGTGFFVSSNGIFITAGHVVDEVLNEQRTAMAPFGIFQFLPNDTYILRPVLGVNRHFVADVAVGIAAPMHHTKTKKPLSNKCIKLSSTPPPIGNIVFTYAYPKTIIESENPQTIRFDPGYFDGLLVESHPNGRDKVLLPGACFRTSMVIHGGASGGPVFDMNGRAFAVNSTGIDDSNISYVSCLSSTLDLEIANVTFPGNSVSRSTCIRELQALKFVK